MSVTLRDVARVAGVSTATVSRVINGGYYVSPDIVEKVNQAVRELGYKRNALARSLRTSKTQTIGVIIPDMSNPYFMSLIQAVEQVVSAHQYHLLISSSNDDAAKEGGYLRIFNEKRVDGLLIAPCRMQYGDSPDKTTVENTPTLFVDGYVTDVNVDMVTEENERTTYKLIQYVLSVGHRKVAIVNSKMNISTAIERQLGFERALREADVPLPNRYVIKGEYNQETGYLAGKRLLQMGADRPTAIFASNNYIAVGLLTAIRESGLKVPDDISIVSFGELLLPQLIEPSVTAIIQNPQKVGSMAGRLLLDKINGACQESVQKFVLPTILRLGESVRPLKEIES